MYTKEIFICVLILFIVGCELKTNEKTNNKDLDPKNSVGGNNLPVDTIIIEEIDTGHQIDPVKYYNDPVYWDNKKMAQYLEKLARSLMENHGTNIKKDSLKFVVYDRFNDGEENYLAYYDPRPIPKVIGFSTDLFLFLKKEFEGDLGLYFVLGHELGHHFSPDASVNGLVGFYGHSHNDSSVERIELEADIFGNFLCYLSGIDLRKKISNFFDKCYKEFGLNKKGTHRYPSLEQRKKSAKIAEQILTELIYKYELGIGLSALKKFEWAKKCFYEVERLYPGPEIYANLATNDILMALNPGDTISIDSMVWPIEFEWNTRLKSIYNPPPKTLGTSDRFEQNFKINLESAEININKAIQKTQLGSSGRLRAKRILIKVLQNKLDTAKKLYDLDRKNEIRFSPLDKDRIHLILTIGDYRAMIKDGKPNPKAVCLGRLDSLKRITNNSHLKRIIQVNIEILKNGHKNISKSEICPSIFSIPPYVPDDQFSIIKKFNESGEVAFFNHSEIGNNVIFYLRDVNQSLNGILQQKKRIRNDKQYNCLHKIGMNGGYITKSPNNSQVIILDQKKKVQSEIWVLDKN